MDNQEIISYVVQAVMWLFHIVSAVLCFKGYHVLCKHDSNKSSEVNDMKYRLPSYREKTKAEAQSFNPLVTQYRFNKATEELEELPDKLDIQKFVDSSLNTALESMFDKFLQPDAQSVISDSIDDHRDTLDRLCDAMDFVEEVKDKYGMSDVASVKDVMSRIQSDIDEQTAKLKAEQDAEAAKKAESALYAKFKQFIANGGNDNEPPSQE